jgi:hypothetical protein
MKRVAAVVAAAGVLATAAPASASAPPPGTCGLGREVAHAAILNPTLPGASEAAREHPPRGW